MTLEDKMKRNIKQIEDAGKCPLQYFLDKTQEECVELIKAIELFKYIIRLHGNNIDVYDGFKTFKEFQSERADLKNCLDYLDILCKDKEIVAGIQPEKVDRGYERGVK